MASASPCAFVTWSIKGRLDSRLEHAVRPDVLCGGRCAVCWYMITGHTDGSLKVCLVLMPLRHSYSHDPVTRETGNIELEIFG